MSTSLQAVAALMPRERLVRREGDDDDADAELVGVVQHLDQALVARQSGQVAQEDDQRVLPAKG
jgi:hypothetical protein